MVGIVRIFGIAFCSFLIVCEVQAEVLRVSNVLEWQSALDASLPGDLIQLAPGTYELERSLNVTRSGLSSLPVTILPLDKAQTIITGPAGMVCSNAQHVVFEDLIWFNITEQPVVHQVGICAIKFQGAEFHKCGTLVTQEPVNEKVYTSPIDFAGCTFRLCRAEKLLSLKNAQNNIVHNTFDGCSGEVRVERGPTTIRANYFLQDNEEGIRFHFSGDQVRVVNNYFHRDQGSAPIFTWVASNGGLFAQNTFYHCSFPVLFLVDSDSGLEPFGCSFENNLFALAETPTVPLIEVATEPSRLVWGKNLVHPVGTFTNWVMGAQMEAEQWLTEDPLLVEVDGIQEISKSSPAIDAGSNRTGATFTDIQGRIRGLRPDIGAHEWSKKRGSDRQPRSVIVPAGEKKPN